MYFQQCTYVLVDAQAAQSNMRALLRVIKTSELDPDAGKARYNFRFNLILLRLRRFLRPDQLVLLDDPAFVPDNIYPMMDLDFSMLESSQGSEHTSALLSGPSRLSSRSSVGSVGPFPGIEIPASGSTGAGFGGFELPGSMPGPTEQERRITVETEEGGFLPDVDFDFDEEGNMIDLGAGGIAAPEIDVPPRLRRDAHLTEQVRMEHEEGLVTSRQPVRYSKNLSLPIPQLTMLSLQERWSSTSHSFKMISNTCLLQSRFQRDKSPVNHHLKSQKKRPQNTSTFPRNASLARRALYP